MKSSEILEVHFKDLKQFFRDTRKAITTRTPLIQARNRIYFASVSDFRNFMTIQKIELLTVIATRRPSSIYELAKFVDREFAAVFRDCQSLAGSGFITLKASGSAKKTKMPALAFKYAAIVVDFPHSPYQIEFKRAA